MYVSFVVSFILQGEIRQNSQELLNVPGILRLLKDTTVIRRLSMFSPLRILNDLFMLLETD